MALADRDSLPPSAFFEPTSDIKSLRWLDALPSSDWPVLSYIAPNIHELRSLQAHLLDLPINESPAYSEFLLSWQTDEIFRHHVETRLPEWVRSEGVLQSALRLLPLVNGLFVKAGSRGLLVVLRVRREDLAEFVNVAKQGNSTVIAVGSEGGLVVRYYEALKLDKTASVVGGGDSLLGGLLAGIAKGLQPSIPEDLDRLVHIGQRQVRSDLVSLNPADVDLVVLQSHH